jgi:hypothetical protein
MDEHGIALGVCANLYVLRSSEKKRSYVKSLESREWASIVEVVSLIGGFYPAPYNVQGHSTINYTLSR